MVSLETSTTHPSRVLVIQKWYLPRFFDAHLTGDVTVEQYAVRDNPFLAAIGDTGVDDDTLMRDLDVCSTDGERCTTHLTRL